ncbi:MAG TPA: hypothetical protein VFK10_00965, partial [Burkholderiaceae bacterium]|nr:hypothetical protein [Burkholderiaceae bacterium]
MPDRDPAAPRTRSFLLRVQLSGRDARYLLYDLRTGECRRFASGIALQRFLVFLKRVHRLH